MDVFTTAIISIFLMLLIPIIILAVLSVVGTWKILTKAGEEGWAAIIPIYSQYMLCKVAGVNPYWLLISCLSFLLTTIPIIGGLLSAAVSIYFAVLLSVSLARSFGKSDGFAIGLVLLPPIFYMILGCDSSEYIGANPMDDFLFGKSTGNNQKNGSVKYCTSCGKQMLANSNFCPYCGNESK